MMAGGAADCNKVITIPQYSGVCWFTTLLMALLYSAGMRKLVVANSKTWKARSAAERGVLDVIKTIVSSHYSHVMKARAYDFFARVTPEALLESLHRMDPARFKYNPSSMPPGFSSTVYLPAMLDLLRVRNIQMFDAIPAATAADAPYTLMYSPIMHGRFVSKREIEKSRSSPPDAVIVFVQSGFRAAAYPNYYYVKDMPDIPLELTLPGRRVRYTVDSVLLGSHNNCLTNHQICGITCDGGRYIYNGWLRKELSAKSTRRAVPCELMPVDWMDQTAPSFKIAAAGCGLERYSWLERLFSGDNAFSFRKGERTYIYTRQ